MRNGDPAMNDDLKNDLNDAMRHGREAARSMLKAMRGALDVAINALDRDDAPKAPPPDAPPPTGANGSSDESR
jgi:hypothetical protein